MCHLYRRSATEKSCDPLLFDYGLWILNKTVEKCVLWRNVFLEESCLSLRYVCG